MAEMHNQKAGRVDSWSEPSLHLDIHSQQAFSHTI